MSQQKLPNKLVRLTNKYLDSEYKSLTKGK